MLPVETRLELIGRLVDAGIDRIEVASFVNPRRVPQMADAERICAALPRGAASYIGLVMNRRGLERALTTTLDEINFTLAAADGYNQRNQGASVSESANEIELMVPEAAGSGRKTSVTISVAFGDPYDGPVDVERVLELVKRFSAVGVDEIAFGDTIGVATPLDVERLLEPVLAFDDAPQTRCHFHNTRNTAYANAVAAMRIGVGALDSSVGGYGGSPFAKGAGGNVATEDLVYLQRGLGVDPGLDVALLIETAQWLSDELGSPLRSMLPIAGDYPG